MNLKICVVLSVLLGALPAMAVPPNNLRVGAYKVDVTPSEKIAVTLKNVWGTMYTGIHDHVYVRAIVLDDGRTSAALVSIDTSSMPETLELRRRVERETGVPAGNVMISTTHTHNAPAVGAAADGRQGSPQAPAYTASVYNAVVESIRQSRSHLQPGRMILATGHADLNVNRDEFVGDRWKTGRNPTRPSDKTVWILRFEKATGEPIAFFVNYGVHALTLGPDNTLLTGDFPGSTSRFIESYYGAKVVSMWTSGPAGDQNLVATSWDLDDVLTHKVREIGEAGFQLSDSLGRILGEEVLRASSSAKDIRESTTSLNLWSATRDVTCPGQKFDQQAYARHEVRFNDADPQTVHMDLLMVNNIALAGVAAEVVTNIYFHLKEASPLADTILVSLNNGRLTYMPDDAAYDAPIFEVRATSLKRGCGEGAIVNSFVEMINQRLATPAVN